MNARVSLSGRLAAASGVAFVMLMIAGFLVLDIPGHDDSDALVNAFYADTGNRARVIVAAYLLAGAGLAFLCFLAHLRSLLRIAEGEPGTLSALTFAGGVVFVATLFAAGAAQGPTYALSIDLYDEPPSQLSRALIPHMGYGMLVYGLLAAAFAITSTSLAIVRTAAFPRWLAWVGFAAAGLLLFGVFFLPMIALPLWVLAVSFALFRGYGATRSQ